MSNVLVRNMEATEKIKYAVIMPEPAISTFNGDNDLVLKQLGTNNGGIVNGQNILNSKFCPVLFCYECSNSAGHNFTENHSVGKSFRFDSNCWSKGQWRMKGCADHALRG